MPTLILTPRFTRDAQMLWRAAIARGWRTERLQTWSIPDSLATAEEPVLYVEGLFGPSLAEALGIELPEPPLDWLPELPARFLKRKIALMPLAEARKLPEPAFVKPPNDKSFTAKVYSPSDLPQDFDDDMPVLVADIVEWESEFRCFVVHRSATTISVYARDGELQAESGFTADPLEIEEAHAFVSELLADTSVKVPEAAVVDVGKITGSGWAVIEQNSAWGAGIYGCDPDRVLDALEIASSRRSH